MAKEIGSDMLLEAICSERDALPAENPRVVDENAATQWKSTKLLNEQANG